MLLGLLALAWQEPGTILDVGVAMPMQERAVIHNARILIRAGKIEKIGPRVEIEAPAGWTHLQYLDSFAFPGAIDLHSHIQTGGWEDINDMVHPDNPELRTLDTIRPWNPMYQDAVAGGVTTVNAIPGSGTNMSGAGTLLKIRNTESADEAVLRYPGSVKVAQGYNPERGTDLGGARSGMWWMLRWWLERARQAAAAGDAASADPSLRHIAGVFESRHPFLVHTAGARDVFGTVRMFQLEAGVPVVVSHCCFDGYKAAAAIAETGAALNVGPRNYEFRTTYSKRFQGLVSAYEAAGSGNISVQTDANVVPQEEYIYQAALAERLGCSTWTALEALNVDPARQILAQDRIGRLAPGLDADVVVKAGQPLDPRTPVQLVLVDGRVVYDRAQEVRY